MPSSPKLMRAALKEALDLFEHEWTYADGRLLVNHVTGEPHSAGGQWVKQARKALGLDPVTGKRPRKGLHRDA